jgi:ABC-type transport system involved in cytochrome c biogenesis permease component
VRISSIEGTPPTLEEVFAYYTGRNVSDVLQRLRAFLMRDFQTELSYRVSFLLNFSGVFLASVTYFFLSRLLGDSVAPLLEAYGGDYFAFAIIGVAFASYFGLGLNGFARALREAQTTGTLEAMIMTPAPVSTIVVGSAAWSYAFTTFRVLVYLLLGILLGLDLRGANYLAALVTLLISIVAFASIGIIAAGHYYGYQARRSGNVALQQCGRAYRRRLLSHCRHARVAAGYCSAAADYLRAQRHAPGAARRRNLAGNPARSTRRSHRFRHRSLPAVAPRLRPRCGVGEARR